MPVTDGWTKEREERFAAELRAQLLPFVRNGLLFSAAMCVGGSIWELAQGAHFNWVRVPFAAAYLVWFALLRFRWVSSRPLLNHYLATIFVSASIAAMSRALPHADEYFIGNEAGASMIFAFGATAAPEAVIGAALQLATLAGFWMLTGELRVVLEAAFVLVPSIGLSAQMAKMRGENLRSAFMLNGKLADERERFEQMAMHDALTGLYNRRSFFEQGQRLVELAHRHQRALSLVIIDIDYFKRVNDNHGHAAGDEVLKLLAAQCLAGLRSSDVFARIGGEELAVLMPETDLEGAAQVSERLRKKVEEAHLDVGTGALRTTISLGVATMEKQKSLERLLEHADAALYEAKRAGRNRVQISVRPATEIGPA